MIIPLTHGKFAEIDDEDYPLVSNHKWHYHEGYAKTNVRMPGEVRKYKTTQMHRVILGAKVGELVDHRDGNGLNKTKVNLRIATVFENPRNCGAYRTNRSGYKGVAFVNKSGTWAATIHHKGRNVQLGKRRTAVEAAKLYNVAAKMLHGDFARLNNVPEASKEDEEIVRRRIINPENGNVNNTSGYRGVVWNLRDRNWVAQIAVHGKGITIGYFDDKEEAAYVYDQFAIQIFGEKAKPNLLKDVEI